MDAISRELEKLYDQCGTQFYHCALSVTQCGAAAEDAVHNAFRNAFRLTKSPDNLKAYLFRSVRNAAIDLVRKDARTEPLSPDMIFDIPASQVDAVQGREFMEDLTKALEVLSKDERETIIQHLVAHLTFQEIATLQDRPMGTVVSWYRRGLEKLKQQLKHEHRPI